jgi:hypothetical protein
LAPKLIIKIIIIFFVVLLWFAASVPTNFVTIVGYFDNPQGNVPQLVVQVSIQAPTGGTIATGDGVVFIDLPAATSVQVTSTASKVGDIYIYSIFFFF